MYEATSDTIDAAISNQAKGVNILVCLATPVLSTIVSSTPVSSTVVSSTQHFYFYLQHCY